jgi:hypothetical protein
MDSAHWRLQGKTDAKKHHTPASLAAMSPLKAIAMHRVTYPHEATIGAADGQHGFAIRYLVATAIKGNAR